MKEIYRLLSELRKELRDKEKMEYTELKEKVDVIETEFSGITENITLKMVDLKKSMVLIDEIELGISNLIDKTIADEYLKFNESINRRYPGFDDTNIDNIPFPDWDNENDGTIET